MKNIQILQIEVIPKYPFQALNPKFNRSVMHSYRDMLQPILPSDDVLHDIPVSVIITHLSSQYTGRPCIYFCNIHSLLCLYNHLDFIKMHMHNAWLLGKTDLTINLPADYFVSPKHLFIFVAAWICMNFVIFTTPMVLITICCLFATFTLWLMTHF